MPAIALHVEFAEDKNKESRGNIITQLIIVMILIGLSTSKASKRRHVQGGIKEDKALKIDLMWDAILQSRRYGVPIGGRGLPFGLRHVDDANPTRLFSLSKTTV